MKLTPPIRGYLLHLTHYDPAWCKTKDTEEAFDPSVAREIVQALAAQQFNVLVVDCADAVEYRSHPELRRRYTRPMADLASLAAEARAAGLEVVPKLNFSRGEINRHNHWMRPPGAPWHHKFEDDAYFAMAFELIDELIEACSPARHFHIGMDEDHDRSYTQYARAIERLHEGLATRNLRAVIWNDTGIDYASGHIYVEKSLHAETRVPKDVVQVIWQYRSVPSDAIARIRSHGFELWGAPGWRDAEQLAEFRRELLEAGGTGMLMTRWIHCRPENRDELLGLIERFGAVYRGETT